MTITARSLGEKFLDHVVVGDGCWEWAGLKSKDGYGYISKTRTTPMVYAHRLAHELFKAPIPTGLQLDHLCRNRGCARPSHLEAVTNRENTLRGEHPHVIARRAGTCIRCHTVASPHWPCRVCARERQRQRYRDDPEYRQRCIARSRAAGRGPG